MKKYVISSFAALTLVLSACGGGGGASGDQAKVTDMMMDVAGEQSIELDRACVEDKAAQLSDADAKALVEAGVDGDPQLSPEGDAIGEEIFSCVNIDSFVDSIVADLPDDGSIDIDCVKEKLGDLKTADEVSTEMMSIAFDCSDLGG